MGCGVLRSGKIRRYFAVSQDFAVFFKITWDLFIHFFSRIRSPVSTNLGIVVGRERQTVIFADVGRHYQLSKRVIAFARILT